MRNRLRIAIAHGNWSNPATWNDNSVPESRDIVALNGKQLTLDQDVTVFGFFNNIQLAVNSFKYLTFNDLPEGKAESSDNSALAWYHFSNITSQYRSVPGITLSTPYWASYEYPNQNLVLLKAYQFNGYDLNHPFNPKSWEFQAWNGTTWVVLDSVVDYTSNYRTYIKELTTNSTAYYKYRFFVTALHGGVGYNQINLTNVQFWEDKSYRLNSIDGGSLTIGNSKTFSVTGLPITGAEYDLINCTANVGSTVNLNLSIRPHTGDKTSITINGTGQYNLTGELLGENQYYSRYGRQIRIIQPCILNVIGNIRGGAINDPGRGISVNANGTIINVVGNLYSGGGISSYAIYLGAATELTVTGDVYGAVFPANYGGGGINSVDANSNITIVGNVYGGGATNYAEGHSGIQISNANSLTVTGNLINLNSGNNNHAIFIYTLANLSVVGSVTANGLNQGIYKTSTVIANNNLSGPFVSSSLGVMPFMIFNFKIIPAFSNSFQFRDNTIQNNPYILYSASTIVDSPSPQNVRQGTTYALGSYTGTLAVPSPNQVSFGAPTDNTIGTAVLRPEDVWNAQTSAMNTAGSIGKRLKNASTVDSTGDQLTSLL